MKSTKRRIKKDRSIVSWGILLLFISGWITNIVNIIVTLASNTPIGEIGSYILLQLIGVPIGPLGAILGVVSWF